MVLGGTLGDAAAVIIVLAVLATAVVIVWPLIRALSRRLEGGGNAPELEAELDALRTRVDQLEQAQGRVAELEERLDFTERMLAQSREPDRLER
jgi:Tfp pilus assembly protein PilO